MSENAIKTAAVARRTVQKERMISPRNHMK